MFSSVGLRGRGATTSLGTSSEWIYRLFETCSASNFIEKVDVDKGHCRYSRQTAMQAKTCRPQLQTKSLANPLGNQILPTVPLKDRRAGRLWRQKWNDRKEPRRARTRKEEQDDFQKDNDCATCQENHSQSCWWRDWRAAWIMRIHKGARKI